MNKPNTVSRPAADLSAASAKTRAEKREIKKKPKMKVSGAGVKDLQKLMGQGHSAKH